MNPSSKKRNRLEYEYFESGEKDESRKPNKATFASLSRSITPPFTNRARQPSPQQQEERPGNAVPTKQVRSPVQLTHIQGLSLNHNIDTVKLRDILGDPMIRECWQFNYCFDVDFVMNQFDQDVKHIVQVKLVHGSWKQDSTNRIRIDEACARYPNVEPIIAYMPEPFGTHHSKMMILLRHDDFAQVVIHTANMLAGDWTNMTQAIWRSPLLPLSSIKSDVYEREALKFGSGARFKRDLLAYLEFYGKKKTGALADQLREYDFTAVRAALVSSVPSREKATGADSRKSTLWGWPALKDTLHQIPLRSAPCGSNPHIVVQVSSIASLGQSDKWLKDVFFHSLCPPKSSPHPVQMDSPSYSIVFPTPDEIRRSLNGYGSGGSIHMKIQSAVQQKQLQYMRPFLCHWAAFQEQQPMETFKTCPDAVTGKGAILQKKSSGRRRAAPHIKTYIRFSDKSKMDCIDWAMITSANLSTQAWGASPNSSDEVRICSWEIGVLFWPDLLASHPENTAANSPAQMIPCFQKDLPDPMPCNLDSCLVGFRMPYDLPLTPYSGYDVPWCATTAHPEPDWLGQTWEG